MAIRHASYSGGEYPCYERVPALGEHGGALLHLAVDVIWTLLQKKTNVGAPDKYGCMPLHLVKPVAAAQVLLDFGANVHAPSEIAELLLQNYGTVHW